MPDQSSTIHQLSLAQRRFHSVTVAALIVLIAYFTYTAIALPFTQLAGGLVILSLAAWPAIAWTRTGSLGIPVFAILSLTNIPAYAIPLLTGHEQILRYNQETIQKATLAIILFQAALLSAHAFTRARPGRSRFATEELTGSSSRSGILAAQWIAASYTAISIFTNWIPYSIGSILNAIFSGLSIITSFILFRMWGRNELSPGEKFLCFLAVTMVTLSQFSTLYLVSGISLITLSLIGWMSGARRLPILPLVILVPILGVLHNGKFALREKYWTPQDRVPAQVSQLPDLYREWIESGLTAKEENSTRKVDKAFSKALLERSSLFHMLCLVVDCTPYRQPFMNGETYMDIPGQFVPRFLWPNKPLGHVSTYKLSIYYGLQREEDTARTTIGFGLLPEAFANFGMTGVIAIGLLIGAAFRFVEDHTREAPLISGAGLFLILLTAWSFQTEFTLSIWLSSLAQACVAVIAIPIAFKRIFG